MREVRSSSGGGQNVGRLEGSRKSKTVDQNQNQMCATTTPLEVVKMPPLGNDGVKLVRMSRGKRMSEEAFNSLPEKEKIRVLRNRRNALKTRARRQARIKILTAENALLEASVGLKEKQIAVLLSLLGGGAVKPKTEDETPVSPTVVSANAVSVCP